MKDEAQKVFFSQFRESQRYLEIVEHLKEKNCSLSEVSAKMKMPSGGGLKRYLSNLEMAEIIRCHTPLELSDPSKLKKYSHLKL